ncbi:MAG: RNA polymerase factor sigma-54 [Rhodanobacteraceae bacterium]
MKQGLQFRLHQQLALTPQLQQAIKLLQMSTLELGSELRQMAEANPLLDLEGLGEDPGVGERVDETEEAQTADADEALDGIEDYGAAPGDSPLQFDTASRANGSSEPWQTIESCASEDLHQHLLWQIGVSSLQPRQQAIAAALVDALDDDGYLRSDDDEIRAALGSTGDVSAEEIETVRQCLLTFDPTGAGARTLHECLAAQLSVLDDDDPIVVLARRIVDEGLELLARNDLDQLAKRLSADREQMPGAVDLIHSLDPKPGYSFDTTPVEYISPDAYAVKRNGRWQVALSPDCNPRLEINQHYCDLIGKTSRDDTSYLRGQLQEARWLIKSLESRADTINKVATAIVRAQSAFLDFGPEAMRPLVLREVAEAIDMHESTVSRVTTRKYLHTPRGIFEFKYFFSSGVGTQDGGSASATAVQAMIRKLVDSENRRKPYSDQALVKALKQHGIQVARRTVAKYRESLRIPNSSQRVQMHE